MRSLHRRLDDNATVLLAAYRASAAELESGRGVVPAAEWLLDNYHLVEAQIREIRDDLPPGYYRQLPKLAAGPFAGYPRVFGLAWAFVAHTDSHFDPVVLRRFIAAYQQVQPLTIGELWAVAITLRIVLIENLRRLTDQITEGRRARADAQALANRLLVSGRARSALQADIETRALGPLSELFAAQLAKRLRDQDPRTTPALGWLEERLQQQGTSVDEVVAHAQQRQGASNVTVRNVITSVRLISDIDWAELFESVSLVDARLREHSAFASMDFRHAQPVSQRHRAAGARLVRLRAGHRRSRAGGVRGGGRRPGAIRPRRRPRLSPDRRGPARPRTDDRLPAAVAAGDHAACICGWAWPATSAARCWSQRCCWRCRCGRWLVPACQRGLAGAARPGRAVPATDVATALVNRTIAWNFGAVPLPALALREGVPPEHRTLVAVPTLLTSQADLLEQIERLEVHHLSGAGGDLAFALLTDGVDAPAAQREGDEQLLAVAVQAIERLNERYGPAPDGSPRFFLLHRERRFNAERELLDGMGAQARQAARTQSPAARRDRHLVRRGRRRLAGAGAACATSSRSMPTRGCRATRRCG